MNVCIHEYVRACVCVCIIFTGYYKYECIHECVYVCLQFSLIRNVCIHECVCVCTVCISYECVYTKRVCLCVYRVMMVVSLAHLLQAPWYGWCCCMPLLSLPCFVLIPFDLFSGSCHKYNFCRDKTCLLLRQKYACRDKRFVTTKLGLSWQKYASHDKSMLVVTTVCGNKSFVMTNIYLSQQT